MLPSFIYKMDFFFSFKRKIMCQLETINVQGLYNIKWN